MKNIFENIISGQIVDIYKRKIYPGSINIKNGHIEKIVKISNAPDIFILPGLIDAHIHIESSMVTPGAFARSAVIHGTTAVISDPHEIANVLGVDGVRYMIDDSKKVPLKFFFGAPSCVPATSFETSGSRINVEEISELLELSEIKYLSEMMNFPGVIHDDSTVIKKLEAARIANKPIDGHAPGIRGEMLRKYVSAGISTDHECSSIEEALEKISLGMKILIREGSAARNLQSLKDLFNTNPGMVMLCSDDLHPEMLRFGHINKLIARLISEGYDIFDVIRSASINPKKHYNLETGCLAAGEPADLIIVDSLDGMNVMETWIDGVLVYRKNSVLFDYEPGPPLNKFVCNPVRAQDLLIKNPHEKIRIIKAFEGELITEEFSWMPDDYEYIQINTENDILKIVVKDRYNDSPPVIGFINGFRLKSGAFASSVAHDSHNIICLGTNDTDIANAVNEIIRLKGGLAVSHNGIINSFQLNIGGIMSTRSCGEVADDYLRLTQEIITYGCTMRAPFMTLSFMALLVIPELKIGDKGLFDVKKFQLVPLVAE